jgi:hypothetical protein
MFREKAQCFGRRLAATRNREAIPFQAVQLFAVFITPS